MKRILSALICLLFISMIMTSQASAALKSDAAVGVEGETAERTILLYICGSNLESESANATYNLKQIMNARFSADDDVRCVVMTGGSFEWHLESEYLRDPNGLGLSVSEETGDATVSAEYNQLWEAKGADAPVDPGTLTLLDSDGITGEPGEAILSEDEPMTDPEVLKAFINYGVTSFPAKKYDLILWNHGGGPTGGFGCDEHDYWDVMSFPKIVDALSDNLVVDSDSDDVIDGSFDFVDFDACLMSSVELCFALADYADYYIASPETEPGYGQYYTGWLNKLGEEPDYDTFSLGKIFVDDFMDFYTTGEGAGDCGTLTVFDLKKLVAPETGFVSALKDLQAVLKTQAETKNGAGEYLFYDELASARDSINYGDDSFVDLGNLASFLSIAVLEPPQDSDPEWLNAYTDIAKRIIAILSPSEQNDVIYARGTDDISTGFVYYRDADGELKLGTMGTSGIYLCFPLKDPNYGFIREYHEAMGGVLQKMPDNDRKSFLTAYRDTVVDYALIRCTGEAVSSLINKGVDRNEIDFDRLYEYWNHMESYYPDDSYTQWNKTVKFLFEMIPGGLTDEVKARINEIIQQQAAEAITSDNVTVDRIRYSYGDEHLVHLKDASDRVVQGVEREIFAELPALEDFIQKYHEKDRGYFEYAGMLSIGTAYGMLDDNQKTDSDESCWRLTTFKKEWLAINDADDNNHVAAILSSDETGIQIPAFYGDPEEPHAVFLEFKYDDDETLTLDTIWFAGAFGSVRGTKAKELTEELTVTTMIYAQSYWKNYCLPISETTFTISKDNYSDIKLILTDINNIPDISDVDGDGCAFYSMISVTDLYGNLIDVTDKVDDPDRDLIDISLVDVQPATATAEELTPVVTYQGQTLEEGVDYTWEKKNPEDAFIRPGDYAVVLTGQGQFTGKERKVFTISAPILGDADGDGAVTIVDVTTIQRVLASLEVDSYNAFASDVDGDGKVSVVDATYIQRYLADFDDQLCIGEKPGDQTQNQESSLDE